MKRRITRLLWVAILLAPVLQAGTLPDGLQLAASSDYEVGGQGGTWHNDDGIAPPRKCITVCSSDYHSCMADCARGAVEEMLGCTSSCRYNYCEVKCE